MIALPIHAAVLQLVLHEILSPKQNSPLPTYKRMERKELGRDRRNQRQRKRNR